jgi:hypothetical protein
MAGQGDLFFGLTQRGGNHISIVGVNPATWKGDLARMAAHCFGALGEDQTRFGPVGNRNEYSSLHRNLTRKEGVAIARNHGVPALEQ